MLAIERIVLSLGGRGRPGSHVNGRKCASGMALPLSVFALVLAVLLLPSVVLADNYEGGQLLTTARSGVVSGGVFVDASPPLFAYESLNQSKTFSLPAEALAVPGRIVWARLYVSAYCGHMQNNYPIQALVSLDGDGDGAFETVLDPLTLSENVPFVYTVNGGNPPGGQAWATVDDHTTRVSSDYLMWYDVTGLLTGAHPGVLVDTSGSFDGRIKVITLVVAYNDGDEDQYYYWVNQGHDVDSFYRDYPEDASVWNDYIGSTTFSGVPLGFNGALLTVNHMASSDGWYTFNGVNLSRYSSSGGDSYVQGLYSGYDVWDVTGLLGSGSDVLTYDRSALAGGEGEYSGQYYKVPLTVLTVQLPSGLPSPGFAADVTSGFVPLTVQFTDQSTSPVSSWTWDFGDGSVETYSSPTNPAHTYTSPGVYSVNLTVTGPGGSQSLVKTNLVSVAAQPPVAQFSASPTSGLVLLSVQFTDQSTGSVTSWAWDFNNDGVVDSTDRNPSYLFTGAGMYNVRLTVSGPGGSNSVVKPAYVSVSGYLSQTGHWSEYDSVRGVAFDSCGNVYIGDNDADNVKVIFANGSIAIIGPGGDFSNPGGLAVDVLGNVFVADNGRKKIKVIFANGSVATLGIGHSFSNPRDVAVDSSGNVFVADAKQVKEIFVNGSVGVLYTSSNNIRAVDVDSSGNVYMADTFNDQVLVMFVNGSVAVVGSGFNRPYGVAVDHSGYVYVADQNNNLLKRVAPDGGMVNLGSITTPWALAVDSRGHLCEADNNGVRRFDLLDIIPVAPPVADFSADVTTGNSPVTVQFNDASAGDVNAWSWSFGDGNTSAVRNPVHMYSVAGNYTVGLTAIGPGGTNMLTRVGYIVVGAPSQCDLTISGMSVNFGNVFVKEANSIIVEVENNGLLVSPESVVELQASDGFVGLFPVPSIAAEGSVDIYVVDPTIRQLQEGSVTYTLTVDPDNYVSELSETNNVMSNSYWVVYNGYKGKRYWAGMSDITTKRVYDLQGGIAYSKGNSGYHSGGWGNYTIMYSGSEPVIPQGAKVVEAYVYASWCWDAPVRFPSAFGLKFNDHPVNYASVYTDKSNAGSYRNFQYGLATYDVTSFYLANNVNMLSVSRLDGGESAIAPFPFVLMVVYQDVNSTRKQILINEEYDVLAPADSYGVSLEEAVAYAPFTGIIVDTGAMSSATLYSFATHAGSREGNLYYNNYTLGLFAYTGSASSVSAEVFDVTNYTVASGNFAVVQGTDGGGMGAVQQVLVVEYPPAANFSTNVTNGSAALTVAFDSSSSSGPIASYAWDFDNDGVVDSSLPCPSYTYNVAGTYSINLTITGPRGDDTLVRTDLIHVYAPVLPAFPGKSLVPSDPDGDGLFEDLNGNGRIDFEDVVTYFQNMSWIRNNVSWLFPYDYNGNGRVDFDDVVLLFQKRLR